jgi:hypothetical protein
VFELGVWEVGDGGEEGVFELGVWGVGERKVCLS